MRKNKYWACGNKNCVNRNVIYKLSNIFQSNLRQILKSPTLIPLFCLSRKPHIEPILYQRLKEWVEIEDSFVDDNSEELKRLMK